MKNRYEVVRQDIGQRLWYIFDNVSGYAVSDSTGETIYYDDYDEAVDECAELNII